MMNKKKLFLLVSLSLIVLVISSCALLGAQPIEMSPQVSQMRTISELAVMDCYYHNVAKFKEEDAEGFWLWKKDKHFWIEYSGIVEIGIDASLLDIVVKDDTVTITMPEARVLRTEVDEVALNEANLIKDKDSADITGVDESQAFAEAEERMVQSAQEDLALLASAQQRAQKLLEEYVMNIGAATGKAYSIEWHFVSSNQNSNEN